MPHKSKLLFATKLIITFMLMMVADVIILAVCLLTWFKGRNVCRRHIIPIVAKAILFVYGIHFTVHNELAAHAGQKVMISNHTSTIDVFILCALGLPNTRFFMSKVTRKYIPLTILGYLMGTFYIDTQDKPAKRRACFFRAEKILRRTGESVYLSPEGRRVTSGEIGRFNRGAFHLATTLKVPIQPFYIHIPKAINPGMGFDALPGHVHIYKLPPIDTSTWTVADINKNKTHTREMFVEFSNAFHAPDHPNPSSALKKVG